MVDLDKMRAELLDSINKKHGKDSIFVMGKREDVTGTHALSTGSLALDCAIGVGGFPRGRIVEIYGPEAAGKSLILLSTIAQIQRSGGSAAFIDAEHALSPDFAKLLGVNIDKLYYVQPESGEKALLIMEELISSCLFDIVGLDSVAALITEQELQADYSDKKPAYLAILMGKALKKMTSIISRTKTVAVFINQLREKPMTLFGSPEYTTGGKALKFYSSLRIDVRRINKEKDKHGVPVGHTVRCTIIKNKVAPPFGVCNIRLDYKTGIDTLSDALTTATELGVITQASSWFNYGENKWNGFEAMLTYFTNNAGALQLLISQIREIMNNDSTKKEAKQGLDKEKASA